MHGKFPRVSTGYPSDKRLRQIGRELGVNWREVPFKEFKAGFKVETEHARTVKGDLHTIARIAIDHITELKDYYSRMMKCVEPQRHGGLGEKQVDKKKIFSKLDEIHGMLDQERYWLSVAAGSPTTMTKKKLLII